MIYPIKGSFIHRTKVCNLFSPLMGTSQLFVALWRQKPLAPKMVPLAIAQVATGVNDGTANKRER